MGGIIAQTVYLDRVFCYKKRSISVGPAPLEVSFSFVVISLQPRLTYGSR
jgi:hypothetical protein